MIRFDSNGRKLQALLGGGVSTTPLPFIVCYSDKTVSTYTGGVKLTTVSSATAVDICDAPPTGTIREIDMISGRQSDVSTQSVTIRYNDSATTYAFVNEVMNSGDQIQYSHATPFRILDINGNIKETIGYVSSGVVLGTTTNDNAPAGRIGEYLESVTTATNFPATGQWGDLASVSATPGDWEFNGTLEALSNSATVSSVSLGISITSGNSTIGLTRGSNRLDIVSPTATQNTAGVIPGYRLSLSVTTTVYLKYFAGYTVATPQAEGRISARRMR